MGHPRILTRAATGLLIVDMQEKLQPVIPAFDDIVANSVRLVLACQMFKMPVVVTEQYPKGLGSTVSILRSQFSLLETIEKIEFSCVRNAACAQRLAALELSTVLVCGVESHVCISQSVLDLLHLGLQVHVVVDAIGARRPIDHDYALRKMFEAGAVPATTEMVLFELAETAGTQSFRNIQRMVTYSLKKTALEEGVAPPQATDSQATDSQATDSHEPSSPPSPVKEEESGNGAEAASAARNSSPPDELLELPSEDAPGDGAQGDEDELVIDDAPSSDTSTSADARGDTIEEDLFTIDDASGDDDDTDGNDLPGLEDIDTLLGDDNKDAAPTV